tara:strand:+ start:397 stop:975 length:579 start_codon:yes stop_codon:yes gene_type:complete
MFDIKGAIEDSIATKKKVIELCLIDIQSSVKLIIRIAKENKSIFWCGNGGSAADSQHMAAELMGGLRSHDRKPIKSIALTTDSSFITAWSNDTNYDEIFSRQLDALGESGDLIVGISTSGNSKNVIEALMLAKKKNIKSIVLTGKSGGRIANMGDCVIKVPSDDTQRIQEAHLLIEHILCESVEKALMESDE